MENAFVLPCQNDPQCKRQDFSKTTGNADRDSVKQEAGDRLHLRTFRSGLQQKEAVEHWQQWLTPTSRRSPAPVQAGDREYTRQAFCRENYSAGLQVSGCLCGVYTQELW